MIERPGFAEWIAESAFRTPAGAATVFYHATDTDADFNIFARTDESSIGFHFGDLATAHRRLEQVDPEGDGLWGAIIPVVCNARKPLRLTDHHTWATRNVLGELYDMGIVNDAQFDFVEDSCDQYALFAAIELAGYDSVVYANETEGGEERTDSLIVWRAEALKGAYASRFDRADPGLVPGGPHVDEDFACWASVPGELEGFRAALVSLATAVPRGATPAP